MTKKMQIRNSTAEFLVFTKQTGDKSIEVRYEDETIWLSQRMMAELFGVDVRTINEHLKNLFSGNELDKLTTIRNFRITATDGKNYNTQFYNLDAIMKVEYNNLYTHFIFTTLHHLPLIAQGNRQRIEKYINGIVNHSCQMYAI